jgi:hypothetical protein
MPEDSVFQGEIDPEIAALLGTGAGPAGAGADIPDLEPLFEEEAAPAEEEKGPDLSAGSFPEITKRFEEKPHNAFGDPGYYKTALSNEGPGAQRLHGLLQKYLNTKDPKDRSLFRQQLIPVVWDFLLGIGKKTSGALEPSKRFLLRFGILHPTFLDAENRAFFAKIVVENETEQPVYYLDEWLRAIGTGAVKVSTTDEVQATKSNAQVQMQQLLEKAQGKLDGSRALVKAKSDERGGLEATLAERVKVLLERSPANIPGANSCYTDAQKRAAAEIQELLKSLLKADRELDSFTRDYREAEDTVRSLRDKIAGEDGAAAVVVDAAAIGTEFDTIRQMSKMTIGRQGNHFPILTSEYFHCAPNDVGFRENVIAQMARIESIDREAFCRSYKNRLNRIVPYVILLPNYGDTGVCWEPFDRHNRATSRGRIAVPMYPKNLAMALLSAVADLRWQVAKEKASYYWMEEGLTGNYYQWFQKQKLKGDVKEYFIQDYITWMIKESEGTQKLDKELRGVFWRYMPFSQPIKEKLKGRSFIYQELYQRDLNRAMSDGY